VQDASGAVVEPVYNLEVEGDHCYRVGQQGLLVHNASGVIEQPASSDPDAPIKDFVPPPSVPDPSYAHLSNPITLIGQSGATLFTMGLGSGTSFSLYGNIKNLTVSQWIRLGDIMGARGGEAGQKYLVIILDTNAGYACIQAYSNPIAQANGVPEFRSVRAAGDVHPDRVILIPKKKTP
jgi:hypothetical protein